MKVSVILAVIHPHIPHISILGLRIVIELFITLPVHLAGILVHTVVSLIDGNKVSVLVKDRRRLSARPQLRPIPDVGIGLVLLRLRPQSRIGNGKDHLNIVFILILLKGNIFIIFKKNKLYPHGIIGIKPEIIIGNRLAHVFLLPNLGLVHNYGSAGLFLNASVEIVGSFRYAYFTAAVPERNAFFVKELIPRKYISIIGILVGYLIGSDKGADHRKKEKNADDERRSYGGLVPRKTNQRIFEIGNGLCLQLLVMKLFSRRVKDKFFT